MRHFCMRVTHQIMLWRDVLTFTDLRLTNCPHQVELLLLVLEFVALPHQRGPLLWGRGGQEIVLGGLKSDK